MDTSSQLPCQIAQALWPFNSRGDRVFGGLPICDAAQMTGRSVGRWDILSGRHRVWVDVRCAAGSVRQNGVRTSNSSRTGLVSGMVSQSAGRLIAPSQIRRRHCVTAPSFIGENRTLLRGVNDERH